MEYPRELEELIEEGRQQLATIEAQHQAEIKAREAELKEKHTQEWDEFKEALVEELPEVLVQYLEFYDFTEDGERHWVDDAYKLASLKIPGLAEIAIRMYHWPKANEAELRRWHFRPDDVNRRPFVLPSVGQDVFDSTANYYPPVWKWGRYSNEFSDLTKALAVAEQYFQEFQARQNEYDRRVEEYEADQERKSAEQEEQTIQEPIYEPPAQDPTPEELISMGLAQIVRQILQDELEA